jgi:hypothetical protein
MMPLESSVSDAKIWSITQELSIMILEAPFTLIYVFSTDITYNNHQLMIIICLQYRPYGWSAWQCYKRTTLTQFGSNYGR